MIDADRYIQQWRREDMKEQRRQFHRAKRAVEEVDRSQEDWNVYHGHYYVVVSGWLLDLAAVLRNSDHDALQQVWNETEFGEHTGLKEVHEHFIGVSGRDDFPPVELLTKVAETLEQFCVHGIDLPEQPPVVEDPWSPDETRDLDELDLDLPEEVDEL